MVDAQFINDIKLDKIKHNFGARAVEPELWSQRKNVKIQLPAPN